MSEEFVSRVEFDIFKQKVDNIEKEQKASQDLLTQIDKKIDQVCAVLDSADKLQNIQKSYTEELIKLKLEPIEKDVEELKAHKTWLWRLIAGSLITAVISLGISVIKLI